MVACVVLGFSFLAFIDRRQLKLLFDQSGSFVVCPVHRQPPRSADADAMDAEEQEAAAAAKGKEVNG